MRYYNQYLINRGRHGRGRDRMVISAISGYHH